MSKKILRHIGTADHLLRISAGEVNFMAVNNAYDAAYQLQVGPYDVFELTFRFNNSWRNACFTSPPSYCSGPVSLKTHF